MIGSIVDFLHAPEDQERILEVLSAPTTRVVSLTTTGGGREIDPGTMELEPSSKSAKHGVTGLSPPQTAFGFIVEVLRRRADGTDPFTVLSCDNIRGNGGWPERRSSASRGYATLGSLAGSTPTWPS